MLGIPRKPNSHGAGESLTERIRKKTARICIIGMGYVGLPTAVILAEKGFSVIGFDVDKTIVSLVGKGKSPLLELDIDRRISKVVNHGKLQATFDAERAISKSDVILIAVPTPTKEGFEPDLSYIIAAGESIARNMHKGQLIILESTVYPGVTEDVLGDVLEKSGLKAGRDFNLAYCPERYNPGDGAHTIDKVTRIVSGINKESINGALALYEQITMIRPVASIRIAEIAKLIENTQRDLNIALMNEVALICEKLGLDVMDVIDAAATKWNFRVYYPGAGVGGHCLPKDPWYLAKIAEKSGYHAQVIAAGRRLNDYMPHHVFELLTKAMNVFGKPIRRSKIVVLGLSYKENVGDLRNSPSLQLIREIKSMGGIVVSIDPFVKESDAIDSFNVEKHYRILQNAFKDADAIVLMTSHDIFKTLNFREVAKIMRRNPILIDGRRLFSPQKLEKDGFSYSGVGKG